MRNINIILKNNTWTQRERQFLGVYGPCSRLISLGNTYFHRRSPIAYFVLHSGTGLAFSFCRHRQVGRRRRHDVWLSSTSSNKFHSPQILIQNSSKSRSTLILQLCFLALLLQFSFNNTPSILSKLLYIRTCIMIPTVILRNKIKLLSLKIKKLFVQFSFPSPISLSLHLLNGHRRVTEFVRSNHFN